MGLGGCGAAGGPEATGDERLWFGVQGVASDVVFSSPEIASTGAAGPESWIASRRDAALGVRSARALSFHDQWPEPTRATLERPRTARTITSSRNRFLFYRDERYRAR